MAPASASRSASRNVIVKRARPRLSNTDTRHGGLRGAGAYADHRRQQDENHVMHADDGEMSEHDQEVPAGRRAHGYADEGSPRPENRVRHFAGLVDYTTNAAVIGLTRRPRLQSAPHDRQKNTRAVPTVTTGQPIVASRPAVSWDLRE